MKTAVGFLLAATAVEARLRPAPVFVGAPSAVSLGSPYANAPVILPPYAAQPPAFVTSKDQDKSESDDTRTRRIANLEVKGTNDVAYGNTGLVNDEYEDIADLKGTSKFILEALSGAGSFTIQSGNDQLVRAKTLEIQEYKRANPNPTRVDRLRIQKLEAERAALEDGSSTARFAGLAHTLKKSNQNLAEGFDRFSLLQEDNRYENEADAARAELRLAQEEYRKNPNQETRFELTQARREYNGAMDKEQGSNGMSAGTWSSVLNQPGFPSIFEQAGAVQLVRGAAKGADAAERKLASARRSYREDPSYDNLYELRLARLENEAAEYEQKRQGGTLLNVFGIELGPLLFAQNEREVARVEHEIALLRRRREADKRASSLPNGDVYQRLLSLSSYGQGRY